MIIDQLGKIQLINADCMRVLSELPDNAFDLAICDPPMGLVSTGKSLVFAKIQSTTESFTHAKAGTIVHRRRSISENLNEFHAIRLFGVQTTS